MRFMYIFVVIVLLIGWYVLGDVMYVCYNVCLICSVVDWFIKCIGWVCNISWIFLRLNLVEYVLLCILKEVFVLLGNRNWFLKYLLYCVKRFDK